jgi:hypothetical protein
MIESNDLPDWNNPKIQMHIFPLNAIDHINNLVPSIKVYVELLKEKQYCPPGAFFIGIKDEELAFLCKLMQRVLAGDIESKISIQHYTDILCTGEGQTDLDNIKDQCNASINFQAAVHLVSCARLLKLQLQYF